MPRSKGRGEMRGRGGSGAARGRGGPGRGGQPIVKSKVKLGFITVRCALKLSMKLSLI